MADTNQAAAHTEAAGEGIPGTQPAPPCTMVIFGAGGDLTKRLLMPALYNLSGTRLLPDGFKVIGVDRAASGDDDWRKSLTDAMQSFTKDKTAEFYTPRIDDAAWGWVTERLHYLQGDFSQAETFGRIRDAVGAGSVVFYLAVAARFFGTVVDGLGAAGLLKQEGGDFRRVVIEKPFGSDLPSAKALNAQILKQAEEEQFYRIDHFLGKETVQSIMAARFANGMFEPLWRREYVDHVQITAAETVGVEERGAFYEPTGALRDMVPNHLFTLMCMVAMEPPNSFDAEDVRAEKAKLIEAVRPIQPGDAVRGQYAPERSSASPCPPTARAAVAPSSRTETYVALRVSIENWRWPGCRSTCGPASGCPGGRRRSPSTTSPRRTASSSDTPVGQTTPNVVRLLIDPEHGIDTQYDVKVPGPRMQLGRVTSSMRYKDFFKESPNVGYETLLYDVMTGDTTLFQRADAIEASWARGAAAAGCLGRGRA